jgi:regulator of sigma E protease
LRAPATNDRFRCVDARPDRRRAGWRTNVGRTLGGEGDRPFPTSRGRTTTGGNSRAFRGHWGKNAFYAPDRSGTLHAILAPVIVLTLLALVGPLIFFHELGHLIAAKLVDVKATRFSLGFGPILARFQAGETEYCLSAIPLGGYVKLLGQHPGEDIPPNDAERTLGAKALWAKYLVLAAGPLANLVIPVVVYFFFYVSTQAVAPPIVGTVLQGSAAEQAQLQQGDRIVAIEGRDIRTWNEMRKRIGDAPEQDLRVQIERDGKRLDRIITPQRAVSRDQAGETSDRGQLGILSYLYAPQVGILDLESPGYQEGLRTGDIITSINGEPVKTIEELERMLEMAGDAQVRLTYLRAEATSGPFDTTFLWYDSHHAQLLPRADVESKTGLLPARTFVRSIDPGSPADKAGLRAGDRILSANGASLHQWETLAHLFNRNPDKPIELEIQSQAGEVRTVTVTVEERVWKNRYKAENRELWFGATPYTKVHAYPLEPLRGRFSYALSSAIDETFDTAWKIWKTVGRLVTFEGLGQLSSVVGIADLSNVAAEQGPGQFMALMAFLSINLAVFNLLPIPILDGGHLLFFTVEAIRRRPLGQRAREIASAIGLVVILLLLLVATTNDIRRMFSDDSDDGAETEQSDAP